MTMRSFKYILFVLALVKSAGAWGQYNPSNPAEPGAPERQYTLTLQADPSGGGSFNLNATTNHLEGETFWVQANTASNFSFVGWTLDGEVVSTNYRFQYMMPAHNVTLVAHYRYTPSNPTEPAEPNIPVKPEYSNLWLQAQPAAGGSFNISSGTSYEVGASVRVQANPVSNFTFVNWTQDGEVIAESRAFDYVMLPGADANRLVAHFAYTPGNPGEPSEPAPKKVYHRVYLMADPVGGGYFNTESGNQFEEGSQQTFRAYNNQWYTFVNWTMDGEVVSTGNTYTLMIPAEDVTLTAHYVYNPSNPNEPSSSTDKYLNVYGMTANGVRGQQVLYPLFLENTEDVYGVTVVAHFPEGFAVNTGNVALGERAAGHTMKVEALGGNAYRFDLTGNQPLTGKNGKIFDVPVTVSPDAEVNTSYSVVLTNAARINLDGSKEVINARSGYIFVEEMKEDGLYAQFSYEKLQGRVMFTNLSADKAVSYKWDFGDGTSSTDKSPLHIYNASGYYDVTLTAYGQTGADIAKMTVLINDESTWQVEGAFFLDTEVLGVRYFTAAEELFSFMSANPVCNHLKVVIKAGETFNLELSRENVDALSNLLSALTENNYTLTLQSSSPIEEAPTLCFGHEGEAIDENVVNLFVALGHHMICDDVHLQLWGIDFNPSKLAGIEAGQTVLSGEPTQEIDFSTISSDLTFIWTGTTDVGTAAGFLTEGEGNIPQMTVTSGCAEDAHLIYNIIATYGGKSFFSTSHTIILKPALEGSFTDLSPADGAQLETTTITLTWNSITNAVYDVYLWNAANQRPSTPVAEGISDLSYTSQNYCQNMKSYKWQVVARNAFQELPSDTMCFTVHMLPNLHVCSVRQIGDLEAGRKANIEWTVRNDGDGSTLEQTWQDCVWLVPDVYGGTNQNNCKLLATVPNAKSLEGGQQYTNQVEVTLDEQSFGNYYILVASDMSTVTNIEWSTVGGTIVTPYNPVLEGEGIEGAYAYLFAKTAATGNKVEEHGETSTRSDNFFYLKVDIGMPTMDEEDWVILKRAYEQMGNGEGWIKTWNFDVDKRTVQSLPGVSILEGHVTTIDLSQNNVTGSFPYQLITLPQLRSLNLSGNQLTGELGGDATNAAFNAVFADSELTAPFITALNISNNQFSGNIGSFASSFPNLNTLYADRNSFTDVEPMIAPAVTTLTLESQTLNNILNLDLTDISASEWVQQIPPILFYHHQQQAFDTGIIVTASADDGWQAVVSMNPDGVSFTKKSEENAYHGESGDIMQVEVEGGDADGSTLNMKLVFDQGDANFSGRVDVVDLQTQINYAFEDYKDKPFNFSAANLWKDDVINVQDVVRMTDLLLSIADNAPANRHGSFATPVASAPSVMSESSEAMLYVGDGKVWIDTETPVAAFELTLHGSQYVVTNTLLKEIGFTCRSNNKGGVTRIVGYSMNGAVLPVGTTAICEVVGYQTELVSAVLSNIDAEEISAGVLSRSETTGIDNTPRTGKEDSSADFYDLQGRKFLYENLSKRRGAKNIYIQNGTKVIK